jgi:hypothetical protein
MIIASTGMTNIQRIHGYEEERREADRKARAVQKQMEEVIKFVFISFCGFLQCGLLRRLDLEMAAVRLPIRVISADSINKTDELHKLKASWQILIWKFNALK